MLTSATPPQPDRPPPEEFYGLLRYIANKRLAGDYRLVMNAADVVQQVYLRELPDWISHWDPSKGYTLASWISFKFNFYIAGLFSQRRYLRISPSSLSREESDEQYLADLCDELEWVDLQDLLGRVGFQEARVLRCTLEGYTYEETAQRTSLSRGQVQRALERGRRRLWQQWQKLK